MTVDTIFDLASLTKVVATTPAIMQLVAQGKISLDAPVSHYWPVFAAHGKSHITVRELLTHTSGLPPDLDLAGGWSGTQAALRRVVLERPVAPPGRRDISTSSLSGSYSHGRYRRIPQHPAVGRRLLGRRDLSPNLRNVYTASGLLPKRP